MVRPRSTGPAAALIPAPGQCPSRSTAPARVLKQPGPHQLAANQKGSDGQGQDEDRLRSVQREPLQPLPHRWWNRKPSGRQALAMPSGQTG
jgi:hypothetical protein